MGPQLHPTTAPHRRCAHLLTTLLQGRQTAAPCAVKASVPQAAAARRRQLLEDDDVLIARRSRWRSLPRGGTESQATNVCRVASLIPLTPEELRQIEACGSGGSCSEGGGGHVQVRVEVLSLNAIKLLRRSHSNPAESAAHTNAAAELRCQANHTECTTTTQNLWLSSHTMCTAAAARSRLLLRWRSSTTC
jgi:hypothetical protein